MSAGCGAGELVLRVKARDLQLPLQIEIGDRRLANLEKVVEFDEIREHPGVDQQRRLAGLADPRRADASNSARSSSSNPAALRCSLTRKRTRSLRYGPSANGHNSRPMTDFSSQRRWSPIISSLSNAWIPSQVVGSLRPSSFEYPNPPFISRETSRCQQPIPATLIPGDGIGPEIMDATLAALDALGAPFEWDRQVAGLEGRQYRRAIRCRRRPSTSIRRTRLALKGPLETPSGGGYRSSNVRLREEFKLYANLRPARTLIPGGRFDNIDLVVVRENLEGLVHRP